MVTFGSLLRLGTSSTAVDLDEDSGIANPSLPWQSIFLPQVYWKALP
jgi:hypothetical protein